MLESNFEWKIKNELSWTKQMYRLHITKPFFVKRIIIYLNICLKAEIRSYLQIIMQFIKERLV